MTSIRRSGFSIGPHVVDPPCVLAPMEGITNRHFRVLIRSLGGCGLTVTEFVSSEGLTRNVARAWKMAELDPIEKPVSIQIYGRNPDRMAEAAAYCVDLGADIVDINMGCPSKRVTSGCAGSALMREPEQAYKIFDAVAARLGPLSVPFTVKMRTGWDQENRNAPEIAARAVAAGAQMIAVHGRTRCDMYKNYADWDFLRRVKDAIDVPMLVNGDILTVADAQQALERSGADGVMVGRGIMRNPWLLRQIGEALRGEVPHEPTIDERRDVLLGYLEDVAERVDHDLRTLGIIKKIAGYFTKGLPHGAKIRQDVFHSESVAEARERLERYFDLLAEHRVRDAFSRRHEESPQGSAPPEKARDSQAA